MPRNKVKHRARAAAHRAEKLQQLTGSDRISKAISLTEYKACPRSRPEPESGSVCLPQVAIFSAGHRKSESVTAR